MFFNRKDRKFESELRFHLECMAEDYMKQGMTPEEARRRARIEFGGTAQIKEELRDVWAARWLVDLSSDFRYAARAFRRNPIFALTAIFCLAIGVLPNTMVFNIAANALLTSPSVRDPKTLFGVILGGTNNVPMPQYRFLQDARPFDGVAGANLGAANWRHGETAELRDAARVTDDFFEVAGIPLAAGRPIQSKETDVVVVSDSFWRNHLGGDPNVLGQRLQLDGRFYTIAGVLPGNHRTLFPFGMSVDLYMPLPSEDWTVALYVRVPKGMSAQTAADRIRIVMQDLERVHPDPDEKWSENTFLYTPDGPGFLKLGQQIGIPVTAYLAMLTIVVGLVLLIACANVSSLLLARASARKAELAIRVSLGAARGRIVRQLLAESLLLVLGATFSGVAITLLLNPVLARAFDGKLVIQPDWRLLCYSATIATIATFACGTLPALNSSRSVINSALKRGSSQHRWTLRGGLVVGQLAVSAMLLCASLLFIRNLQRASTINPGFDVDHTVRANMHLIPDSNSRAKRKIIVDSVLERIRATPGIESASVAALVPLAGNLISQQDWSIDANREVVVHLDARFNVVGADYFRTMQIPILQGREFQTSDREGSPRVVILNQNMARALFGNSNPVGHFIRPGAGERLLIVGLARDSKYSSLGEENTNAYYQSYLQVAVSPSMQITDQPDLHFLIRASGLAVSAVAPTNQLLTQVDPDAALDVKPMRENLRNARGPSQVAALVLGSMGLLGLFLASFGLYGVLLYSVNRRAREIGIRVALGATRANILRLVVGESIMLAGAGIAIGLGVAVFAVRPLSMFLIEGLRPSDPSNFAAVAAVLCLVAALATISPALRALRADPMTVLRYD